MSDGEQFLSDLKKWQDQAKLFSKQVDTAASKLAKVQAIAQPTQQPPLLSKIIPGYKTPSWIAKLKGMPTPSSVIGKQAELVAAGLEFGDAERKEYASAVQNYARATWFSNFYSAAPQLVKSGKVNTVDDYLTAMKSDPEGILTPDDMAAATESLARMKETYPLTDTGAPSWSEATGEEEEQVREFLRGMSEAIPMQSVTTMTTTEIAKALKFITPVPELPEGWTDEDILKTAALMGIPAEALADASTIEAVVEEFSRQAQEQEQKIKDVLAGLSEWEKPKLSVGERLKLLAISPFQAVSETMQPYIQNVTYPISGFWVLTWQRFLAGTQDLERNFDQLRAEGKSVWSSLGESYTKDDSIPWWGKLAIEIFSDPITYIPGWGLSAPAKAAKLIGLVKVSRALTTINRGMYVGLDVPFTTLKAYWLRLPKSFKQEVVASSDQFIEHLEVSMQQVNPGKTYFNAADFEKTITAAVDSFRANPAANDTLTTFGSELHKFTHMNPEQIEMWSRKLGGKLTKEAANAPSISQTVNDAMAQMVNKTLPAEAAAKVIASALDVADEPVVIKQVIKDANVWVGKSLKRIQASIDIAKTTTTTNPYHEAAAYLRKTQQALLEAELKSKKASGDFLSGVILGLQRYTDKFENGRFHLTVDRYLTKFMAEAYLGNASYAIWNAFEGVAISMLEGVVPGVTKLSVAREMFRGTIGLDASIRSTIEQLEKAASDVAGMKLNNPNRISLIRMPELFKIPFTDIELKTPSWMKQLEWVLGGKYIDASNTLGNIIRVNFITKKMAQHLYRLAEDKYGTRFVIERIAKLAKGAPKLSSNSRLGLSKEVLEDDMFYRILSGDIEQVLAAHEIYTNGSLMQAEQLKILRKYTSITPRARVLAEEDIKANLVMITDIQPYSKVADSLASGMTTEEAVEAGATQSMVDYVSSVWKKIDKNRTLYGVTDSSQMKAAVLSEVRREVPDRITDFAKKVVGESIKDLKLRPGSMPDTFEAFANKLDMIEIKDADTLMSVYQSYRVLAADASNLPSFLMTQAMEEAAPLRGVRGGERAIDKLFVAKRAELEAAVSKADFALERIKNKIVANTNLITTDQADALIRTLDGMTARNSLKASTLALDRDLLDKFWTTKRVERDYDKFWHERQAIWVGHMQEDAVLAGQEFVAGGDYAKLYSRLPPEKLTPVDATNRALSQDDVAKILGTNVDGLSSGLMDNTALTQFKAHFVQMVLQRANGRPDLFKEITEQKIGTVYDEILQGMKMSPEKAIAEQKIMLEGESMRQELVTLKLNGGLSPSDEKAVHIWIDNAAKGMKSIFNESTGITKADWLAIRQEASHLAHQDYYKAFADYTNQNIIDAMMRTVMPFWNYHLYRWFFLPRTFVRHPGVALAWGKYNNYTDNGYVHIPNSNLDMNPFVSSVMGATFGLARHDFKSYYNNLGLLGEGLDFWMRRGFFPGAQIMLPVTIMSSVVSGRTPELGEMLPPVGNFGLGLFTGSNIPGVKDAAIWLQDRVFHNNFRDYYISTEIAAMQADAGGNLIGGQSGVDLWFKIKDKVKLTEEEQNLWDEAYRRTAWYGVLRSQFPQFRVREEEYTEAFLQVTKLIESQLGMTAEYQEYLWQHNLRPTDIVGGLPLDLKNSLDQMWQWKIWFGRGQILMPADQNDLAGKINSYWNLVKSYQTDRITRQTDTDAGFLTPTDKLHFTGSEWRTEYADNWSQYALAVEDLANYDTHPEFADAIDAMTPEGQVRLAKTMGYAVPVSGPLDEAINLYFSLELKKKKDPYTGEEDDDYLGFWLNREAVRQALTDEQRQDFDAYIRRYETPMERLFKDVTNRYLRGYRATTRIMLEDYTNEQQALIAEFYADKTTLERKQEIQAMTNPKSGRQLISEWSSILSDARASLRTVSPKLDFWLYVFGYTTVPKTDAAQSMISKWEQDKSSILAGY